MKKFWVKRVVGIILIVAVAITLISYIVMSLWNGILVGILGVKAITYAQALGILVLSKILFGGRCGWGRGGGRPGWGRKMREKWNNMTPEERENWKQEWRNRCGRWKAEE